MSIPTAPRPIELELDLANACGANCSGCPMSAARQSVQPSLLSRTVPEVMMTTARHVLDAVGQGRSTSIAFPTCITLFPDDFEFPQLDHVNSKLRLHLSDAILAMEDGKFESFITRALSVYPDTQSLEFVLHRGKEYSREQVVMLLYLLPKIFPILLGNMHLKKIEFWMGTNEGTRETTEIHKGYLGGILDVFAGKMKWGDFVSLVDPTLDESKPLMQAIVPLIITHHIQGGSSDWSAGKNAFYNNISKRANWVLAGKSIGFVANVSDLPIGLPNRKEDLILVCAGLINSEERQNDRVLCHMSPKAVFAAHFPLFAAIPGVIVSHEIYHRIVEDARTKGILKALYDYYYPLAEAANGGK